MTMDDMRRLALAAGEVRLALHPALRKRTEAELAEAERAAGMATADTSGGEGK